MKNNIEYIEILVAVVFIGIVFSILFNTRKDK